MSNVLANLSPSFVIIGYGNDLRGDDAAGLRVSDAIASWKLANVSTLCVPQLTPELAESLANVDVTIFVDAYPATAQQDVQVCPIKVTDASVTMGHSSNPSYLLTLTQAVYGCSPQGWWVMVPGVNFELGESLSSVAERGIEIALEKINHLIKTVRKELCMKLE
ncbi:MAG: hydrogenase maturation protease [Scytonema sp. RU_4_4]|nr:hydrogenase maturation protease [Scytonema sp. RU_4_4]NJR76502.1 hydrogenase maturation protease [Scytonema sp. CRU_2_7]